jgi:hypothetical protein
MVVMIIPAIVVIVIAVRAAMMMIMMMMAAAMMVMMPPTVMVMTIMRTFVPDRLACRQWVKLRRTQSTNSAGAATIAKATCTLRITNTSP